MDMLSFSSQTSSNTISCRSEVKNNERLKNILCICETNGSLGAALYNSSTKNMDIANDCNTTLLESMIGTLIQQVNPKTIMYPEGCRSVKNMICSEDWTVYGVYYMIMLPQEDFLSLVEYDNPDYRLNDILIQYCENIVYMDDIDSNHLSDNPQSHICAKAILGYIWRMSNQKPIVCQVSILEMYAVCNCMQISNATQRALCIIDTEKHPSMHINNSRKEGLSLLRLLDKTKSPGGREMLRQWISCPLQEVSAIRQRLESVQFFFDPQHLHLSSTIRKSLGKMRSMKSICQRLQTEMLVSDLRALVQFSDIVIDIQTSLESATYQTPSPIKKVICIDKANIVDTCNCIINTVDFDSSYSEKRVVVLEGINTEVDKFKRQFQSLESILRTTSYDMSQDTGVPTAAVYFPQIGFLSSIEIVQINEQMEKNITRMWELKFQTDNRNYYKTPTTRVLDDTIGDIYNLLADSEAEVCLSLQEQICKNLKTVCRVCEMLYELDCYQSFAAAAEDNKYNMPIVDESECIHIIGGRHPIVEKAVCNDNFIPNDMHLIDRKCTHLSDINPTGYCGIMMTGPNSSGKSVYLSQTALIVYMAHIGSFVPAQWACIGLIDRIAVIGRTPESITSGESSLKVDLRNMSDFICSSSPRSLILLDEFGRGTTSSDGAGLLCGAIQAIVCKHEENKPFILAATHFKEISEVLNAKELWQHIQRMSMGFSEEHDRIVYLYRAETTHAKSSYALLCARTAGIPEKVLSRAQSLC